MQNQNKSRSNQKYDSSDPRVIEVESWLESLPSDQRTYYVDLLKQAKKDGLDLLTVGLMCKNQDYPLRFGQQNTYSPTAFRSGVSRPMLGSASSQKSQFWHWFNFFTDLDRGFKEDAAMRNLAKLPKLLDRALEKHSKKAM